MRRRLLQLIGVAAVVMAAVVLLKLAPAAAQAPIISPQRVRM